MPVNQRIRAVRRSTGLGQTAFGRTINVTQSGVDRYEKDGYEVPNSVIATIIKVYNIHTDWLMFGDGEDDNIRYKNEFVDKERYDVVERKLTELQEELIKYQKAEILELKVENRATAQN